MKLFTDRSTVFGIFYVAVGNTELSNKMALYANGQEVTGTKTFYFPAVLVLLWGHNIVDSFLLC
jgi:hypothetical protein